MTMGLMGPSKPPLHCRYSLFIRFARLRSASARRFASSSLASRRRIVSCSIEMCIVVIFVWRRRSSRASLRACTAEGVGKRRSDTGHIQSARACLSSGGEVGLGLRRGGLVEDMARRNSFYFRLNVCRAFDDLDIGFRRVRGWSIVV